jgi:hypothetical protein
MVINELENDDSLLLILPNIYIVFLLNLYTRNTALLQSKRDVEREEMLEGKSNLDYDPQEIGNHPDVLHFEIKGSNMGNSEDL